MNYALLDLRGCGRHRDIEDLIVVWLPRGRVRGGRRRRERSRSGGACVFSARGWEVAVEKRGAAGRGEKSGEGPQTRRHASFTSREGKRRAGGNAMRRIQGRNRTRRGRTTWEIKGNGEAGAGDEQRRSSAIGASSAS